MIIKKPICSTLLLYQKEEQKATSGIGLPTSERLDHQKPLSSTPYTPTHQLIA